MAYAKNLSDISFIREVDVAADPFSEVGDRGGVDNPGRMLEGWTGWAARGRELQPDVTAGDLRFEASIGRFLTSPAALLQILSDRRRAVALISAEGRNYKGEVGRWTGTGFIVGPNLLLTNHHVLNTIEVVRIAKVEFDYEISAENLLNGVGQPIPASQLFKLDGSRLFLTSPTQGGLDYTFVWIEDMAAQKFGIIPLERSSFTVNKRDQAFVVHHPDGQHKQVSLDDADILGIETTVIHYSSDTLEGSSGAPVFDRRGRLIALHHASREQQVALPDGGTTDRVNEGIKIAAIALDLENRARGGGDDAAYAETILKEIKGSDTMSGFFGGIGRDIAPGRTALEAVIETYRGTDQDIDLGFWNIEWLAYRWTQPGKLDGAAKVITDLNLDAWGLLEVSPLAVKALVERIYKIYGDHYDCAFSEPNLAPDRPSAAMMWKRSSLTGKKVNWPSSMEPLFHQRDKGSNPHLQAVHTNIFERYPAVYRFSTVKHSPGYSFFAVPLHLKAMDEGSIRRRLAARILARAAEDLAVDGKIDIIIGGDMNAPLASGDFSIIERTGCVVLGAQDEHEGAFSYIRSPKSTVDNIFLSPSMRQTAGKMNYFIVAKDRTVPDYLAISDHRPIAVRLSLATTPIPERSLGQDDLDAMINRMLGPEKGTRHAARGVKPQTTRQRTRRRKASRTKTR
jgi:endonuclease G, mitochondrial